MKDIIESWLHMHARLKGLLACGVRYPDETFFILPVRTEFPKDKVEYSLRGMADTFQVLKLNNFPNQYVRWIYENALFYCMKREDGIFLGLFTGREPEEIDLEALGGMLTEFTRLPISGTAGSD